jgi:hypothetical protein
MHRSFLNPIPIIDCEAALCSMGAPKSCVPTTTCRNSISASRPDSAKVCATSSTISDAIFAALVALNRDSSLTILLVEQNARLALEIASYGYILENGPHQGTQGTLWQSFTAVKPPKRFEMPAISRSALTRATACGD